MLERVSGKSKAILKTIAMSLFPQKSIKNLMAHAAHENIKLGFLYGVHNEFELLTSSAKPENSCVLLNVPILQALLSFLVPTASMTS